MSMAVVRDEPSVQAWRLVPRFGSRDQPTFAEEAALMSQRFKVVDASGHVRVAYKTAGQRYETSDPVSGDMPARDDRARYELEDGRQLDYHEDSEQFEIVATGERLTRLGTSSG
jgi:hypothetical protein